MSSHREEGLAAEAQRLALIVDSLGDAVIVTEPGSSTITAINRRAAELVPELGIGAEVDGPDSPLPSLEAALRGESTVVHQSRVLAVTATRVADERGGVVWTVRDISERARLERAKS